MCLVARVIHLCFVGRNVDHQGDHFEFESAHLFFSQYPVLFEAFVHVHDRCRR